MMNLRNQAAAIGPNGGVLVGELGGEPVCVRYVGKIGNWEHRDEFVGQFVRAAAKIGFRRDKRTKCGFRKVAK
ncbi:MAG: hypothetical protein ACPG4X_20345 [Pikeienuella sp.]